MATNTSTNSSPESNLQTGGSDPMALMNAVIQKQLSTSGMVSSATPTLEASILSAQKGVREAVVGENAALQSKFEREMGYGLEAGQEAMTAGRAAGSGGILNMAALRSLTETTDKSLKDLQQRKEELIMQNNSAAAAKIADLEYKAIEFRERANQQVFSNLLGIANFGLNQEAQKISRETQTFQQEATKSTIALKYGLNPTGKTLTQLTQEAMIFAGKEQQAGLAKLISETNLNNANAAKVKAGDISGWTPGALPIIAARMNELSEKGIPLPGTAYYEEWISNIADAKKTGKYTQLLTEMKLQANEKIKMIEKSVEESQKSKDSFSGMDFNPETGRIENYTIDPFTREKVFTGSKKNLQIDFKNLNLSKINNQQLGQLLNIKIK